MRLDENVPFTPEPEEPDDYQDVEQYPDDEVEVPVSGVIASAWQDFNAALLRRPTDAEKVELLLQLMKSIREHFEAQDLMDENDLSDIMELLS